MQNKQWILLGVAIVLVGLLFFFGKTTKKKSEEEAKASVSNVIDFETYEQTIIKNNQLPDSLVTLINLAKQQEKDTQLIERIIHACKDAKQANLYAYYQYKQAQIKNTPAAYENAGYALMSAYKINRDSNISNNIITFALQSFKKVLDFEPDNVDAKIQMAEIYVQDGQEPMKGIEILKGIVEKNPENLVALTTLGRLSLQSGQYDKAKERLEKVLQLDPQNTEAIYFLAFTEAELGNKQKAIQLMELCKTLVNNPEFDKEIEQFINELKK
ncbi:MAG: tetratricopeptide repeat protein [Sphingobacteriales bacterium]|nr:MAG: tetratricopeptide repeat protein [Sphingobacteriales bacterium]